MLEFLVQKLPSEGYPMKMGVELCQNHLPNYECGLRALIVPVLANTQMHPNADLHPSDPTIVLYMRSK